MDRDCYGWGVPSIAALRHAPWSLSKIQCALRCPREFYFRYVERVAEPEVAPETRLGKAIHAVLEATLTRTPLGEALATGRRGLMSDEEQARFGELGVGVESFLVRIDGLRRRRRVRAELIEHRLGLTFDLSPTDFVARVFAVMAATPQHTYQLLTKRATRLRRLAAELPWPPNVWMGVSVESADVLHRVDELRRVPATVRFLSCEPLLGSGRSAVLLQAVGRTDPEGRRTSARRSNLGRDAATRSGTSAGIRIIGFGCRWLIRQPASSSRLRPASIRPSVD